MAMGCRGDVRLHGGARPCVYTAHAALPSSTQRGWHMVGTQLARPHACHIDQLNGELMAIAPLGQGSSSVAAIGKADP